MVLAGNRQLEGCLVRAKTALRRRGAPLVFGVCVSGTLP